MRLWLWAWGGQYLGVTGWCTLSPPTSSVDPAVPGQELGCSWGRGAILWTSDLKGCSTEGRAEGPFSVSQRVALLWLPKCRLGNATYYPSLEEHSNLQTLEWSYVHDALLNLLLSILNHIEMLFLQQVYWWLGSQTGPWVWNVSLATLFPLLLPHSFHSLEHLFIFVYWAPGAHLSKIMLNFMKLPV